jgi:hypothetical protein
MARTPENFLAFALHHRQSTAARNSAICGKAASPTGSKTLPHRPVIAPISIRRGGVVRAMPNG